jgi:hypothetical protein
MGGGWSHRCGWVSVIGDRMAAMPLVCHRSLRGSSAYRNAPLRMEREILRPFPIPDGISSADGAASESVQPSDMSDRRCDWLTRRVPPVRWTGSTMPHEAPTSLRAPPQWSRRRGGIDLDSSRGRVRPSHGSSDRAFDCHRRHLPPRRGRSGRPDADRRGGAAGDCRRC